MFPDPGGKQPGSREKQKQEKKYKKEKKNRLFNHSIKRFS
jgi:hypothetical protein